MTTHPATSLPSILLVDDDQDQIRVQSKALKGIAAIRFATSGPEALRIARLAPPDLILLDAEMPGMSGFDVFAALGGDAMLSDVPVIFVTSHVEAEFEESGLALGAVDYISKPVRPAVLAARVRTQLRLKQATDTLRVLSSTDGLTGLANRRAFDDALQNEWRRSQRSAEPLSLLMIDVDHFKKYNDHYGHPQGDVCLAAVAQAMKAAMKRPADLAARYGGEEFALLLPCTDLPGAHAVAERVLDHMQRLGIPHALSDTAAQVTVSIGLSCFDQSCAGWPTGQQPPTSPAPPPAQPSDLVKAADLALYTAKRQGRAQWQFSPLQPLPEQAPPAKPGD